MRARAFAMVLLAVAGPVSAQTVAESQQELARLRSQISEITQSVQTRQLQRDSAVVALAEAEQGVGVAASAVRDAEQSIAETAAHLLKLGDRRADIETDLRRERTALAEQVRAAYRYGRQERIKLLLMQDEPARIGRVLGYYDALNRARAARIRRVVAQSEALDEVQAQIREEQDRQAAFRAERELELEALMEARLARQRALDAIEERLQAEGERLARLESDAKDLQALIDSLQQALREAPARDPVEPFPGMKGRLPWPLNGAVRARFGDSRSIGSARWQGVLIEAPGGRQVKAIHPGRVVFSDWLRGYGLLVIVDHGDDYLSVYAHNQSVYPEAGDRVEQGEVIATVGNSGGSDREALYFEIRKGGKPVNPTRWLARR